MATIIVYQAADRSWRWRLVDGNHRIIADSAEGYVSRATVARALKNVLAEMASGKIAVKELKA